MATVHHLRPVAPICECCGRPDAAGLSLEGACGSCMGDAWKFAKAWTMALKAQGLSDAEIGEIIGLDGAADFVHSCALNDHLQGIV